MKRIAFLFGICLLALAFLVTGAELAARILLNAKGDGEATLWMSTQLVWRAVAPHSFLMLHKSVFWTVLQHVLVLPGWVLFGLPGLALVIGFRPRDADELEHLQNQAHEDALYLFDELALAAQKEGYDGHLDDRAPSDPNDIVPAEKHFADDPVEAVLEPQRDFLLSPGKPADQSSAVPERNDQASD